MAHWQKLTKKKKAKFLAHIEETTNVSEAARLIDIARAAVYAHKKKDAEFSAAWDDAIEAGVDALEGEATRRALKGVKEPLIHLGKQVVLIAKDGSKEPIFQTKYSDSLLIFLLKGRRPEKYKDRSHTEMTGLNGEPLEYRELSEPERNNRIAAIFDAAAKARAGSIANSKHADLGADTGEADGSSEL